jgi:hypothetical protein
LDSTSQSLSKEAVLENQAIRQLLLTEINKHADTFIDFMLLDNKLVTKLVRDEFQTVGRIDFSRKTYFNSLGDFGVGLYAVVIKNDEYFVGCIEERNRENFLVWSMQGNSDGEFFKEVGEASCENSSLLKFTLHPKSLFGKETEDKIDGADSLSGMRIYRQKDFANLIEIIIYLQKNSFEIRNIYVNELKLVDIDLGDYVLKINLEKLPQDTIADFETISRAGKLQKYINEDKKAINYIDLTFKDKVFFKLKGAGKSEENNDIMATSSQI